MKRRTKILLGAFLVLIILIVVLIWNNTISINDKEKRNEKWAWWVDAKTGIGSWIPVVDENQIQDKGSYSLFYADGNLYERGSLDKGEYIDTVFKYDSEGQLQAYYVLPDTNWYFINDGPIELNFQKGNRHIEGIVQNHAIGEKWKVYNEDGIMLYKRDLLNYKGWEVHNYENGNLMDSVFDISKDSFITRNMWYENGNLKYEMGLKDGIRNGVSREFYENGKLEKIDSIYINGLLNGIQRHYYENGQLEQKSEFKNGMREINFFYYESGNIKALVKLKNNLRNGMGVVYFENGKIQAETNFVNGQPDGEVKQYNEQGELIRKVYWENGAMVKTINVK